MDFIARILKWGKKMEDYTPYEDRAEHDFFKLLAMQMKKIKVRIDKSKEAEDAYRDTIGIIDGYHSERKTKRRKHD